MTAPRRASGTLKLGAAVALAGAATVLVAVQASRLFAEARVATTTSPAPRPPAPSARPFHEPSPRGAATYSNIYQADYVGPEACGKCHETNYELWRTHPHSTMNRNATATSVVGDFADRKLVYGDGSALFFQDHGEFGMTVYRQGKPVRQFRVTRVVGSRFIQYYIGVQVEGPESAGDPVYAEEVKLPFAYWIDRAEWFPQTYDETLPGPEYDEHGKLSPAYATSGKQTAGWKRVCVKCHNTYPYAQRFAPAHGDTLTGFPAGDVALRTPPRPPAPGHGALPEVETWDLVTMGISCESCHFGGREHAQHGARISFLPRGEDLTFTKAPPPAGPTGKSAYAVNSICHQCHAAEPQGPLYPDGSASWNAREAADLVGGACSGAVACTDCHNPHEPGPARAGTPDSPATSRRASAATGSCARPPPRPRTRGTRRGCRWAAWTATCRGSSTACRARCGRTTSRRPPIRACSRATIPTRATSATWTVPSRGRSTRWRRAGASAPRCRRASRRRPNRSARRGCATRSR